MGTVGVFREGSVTDWTTDPLPTVGALCHRADGLYCNVTSAECVPVTPPGEGCAGTLECEEQSFCLDGTCTPRLQPGMTCSLALGECANGSYCDQSGVCKELLGAGESCKVENPGACASSACVDGVCTSPLQRLCGQRSEF